MAKKTYGYVDADYLAAAAELFAPIKRRSYELMGDIAAQRLLDLGCGPGLDTVALAALTGDQGFIAGVDCDADMVARAQLRAEQAGLAQRVAHHRADACHLPFADNHFDALRSERLFMHLARPRDALAEAVRVTRPGGRIVLVDTDWGSLSAEAGRTETERRLTRFRAEKFLANGYSGRRLPGLMRDGGLRGIELETHALHVTDPTLWRYLTQADELEAAALQASLENGQPFLDRDELDLWREALRDAHRRGLFFSSVTVVIAAATVAD